AAAAEMPPAKTRRSESAIGSGHWRSSRWSPNVASRTGTTHRPSFGGFRFAEEMTRTCSSAPSGEDVGGIAGVGLFGGSSTPSSRRPDPDVLRLPHGDRAAHPVDVRVLVHTHHRPTAHPLQVEEWYQLGRIRRTPQHHP